ncbi:MAG: hypothetical protein RMJ48_19315 [Roseiflexaceae bacterium]|nr:hypothetical protein [Roseiflexaceae bacterium]
MWPSRITGFELLDYTQTDRADGYEFRIAVRCRYQNGVETIWSARGEVHRSADGQESIIDITAQGVPPSLTPDQTPQRIRTTTSRGERKGDRKEVVLAQEITFLNGHTAIRKGTQLLPADAPQFSVEQKISIMKRALAGEPLDTLIFGRDWSHESEEAT